MEVQAQAKYIRLSPQKVRLVARLVQGMPANAALVILGQIPKVAAKPLILVIRSALANATHNLKLQSEDLKIKKIEVGEGPSFKRWRPQARGVAHPFKKRTSHLKVILKS